MNHFTPFDKEPSELTIHIIKTLAHHFPTFEELQANESIFIN